MAASRLWAVIGAGPCGVATVGRLLDRGKTVLWVDRSLGAIGRMGDYYRHVPANTPNGDLVNAFKLCSSFGCLDEDSFMSHPAYVIELML